MWESVLGCGLGGRGEVWGPFGGCGNVRVDVRCVKNCGGKMWESVWGECGEVCWGGGRCGERHGYVEEGKGRCGSVKKYEGRCGKVYGVSVGKCVWVWEGEGRCRERGVGKGKGEY